MDKTGIVCSEIWAWTRHLLCTIRVKYMGDSKTTGKDAGKHHNQWFRKTGVKGRRTKTKDANVGNTAADNTDDGTDDADDSDKSESVSEDSSTSGSLLLDLEQEREEFAAVHNDRDKRAANLSDRNNKRWEQATGKYQPIGTNANMDASNNKRKKKEAIQHCTHCGKNRKKHRTDCTNGICQTCCNEADDDNECRFCII
jgi:hypothetical protein